VTSRGNGPRRSLVQVARRVAVTAAVLAAAVTAVTAVGFGYNLATGGQASRPPRIRLPETSALRLVPGLRTRARLRDGGRNE